MLETAGATRGSGSGDCGGVVVGVGRFGLGVGKNVVQKCTMYVVQNWDNLRHCCEKGRLKGRTGRVGKMEKKKITKKGGGFLFIVIEILIGS